MRIEIILQAPDREQLLMFLNRILSDVSKPSYMGIKERGNNYGYTWEIGPDKNDGTNRQT